MKNKKELIVILLFVFIKFGIHLFNSNYGLHRDELYFVAISENFSLSNLDALPLSPLFYKIFLMFGDVSYILHFASALCGVITLLISILIVKEFGGSFWSILIAGSLHILSGFLPFGSLATYEATNIVIWSLVLFIILKYLKTKNENYLYLLGILFGLGLNTKLTIIFLGASLFVALLLTENRRIFKEKEIWIAGLIALMFSIPYLIWQYSNNWYFLSFAESYSSSMYQASAIEFLWNQILPMNPLSFPIWFYGLINFLVFKKYSEYRIIAYMYVILFVIFFFLHTPFYFIIPFYTILIPVGVVEIEKRYGSVFSQKKILKYGLSTYSVLYIAISLIFLPLSIPILNIKNMENYCKTIGVDGGIKTTGNEQRSLPQHIADRFGWKELTENVIEIYYKSNNNKNLGIIANNWGEASAIYYYGKGYKLPFPISTDGWFYFETLSKHEFKDEYIVCGMKSSTLRNFFSDVEVINIFKNDYCTPAENGIEICYCKKPKVDLKMYWSVFIEPEKTFHDLLKQKRFIDARKYYMDKKNDDSMIVFFTEEQINKLGNQYLKNGENENALEVFKLNILAYGESANVYRSLAKAYLKMQNYSEALNNYKIALQIESNNVNDKKKIMEFEKKNNI